MPRINAAGTLGRRMTHVHFSDGGTHTYARHLPLGKGALDLDAIVQTLPSVGFEGTLANDLYICRLAADVAHRNGGHARRGTRLGLRIDDRREGIG